MNPNNLKSHKLNDKIYGTTHPDEGLVESVKEHGVMEPLVVKEDGTIISGHRRWQAALSAGLEDVPVRTISFDSEIDECETIIEYNRQREKTFSQKMAEADELKVIAQEKARGRQSGNQQDLWKHFHNVEEKGTTRDEVAEKVGIGTGRTYDKANKVWEAAQEGDEQAKNLVEDINEGKETISGAYKKYNDEQKREKRRQDIERQKVEIEQGVVNNPTGKYDVIVMDPPWAYGRKYDPNGSRVANPYPEMSQEQLLDLNVADWASDNSALFLWTTHKFLFDAKQLMDHWGFQHKAIFVWDKVDIGMGAWFRMQCEFCLVGVKGRPFWDNTKWRDIIEERRRQHSRKPEMFYEMVEDITAGKRLEYFAREAREGWEVIGNDTNKF